MTNHRQSHFSEHGRSGHRMLKRGALLTALVLLASCSNDGSPEWVDVASSEAPVANGVDDSTTAGSLAAEPSDSPKTELTLLAYDSFVAPASLARFTAASGIEVVVATGGDTGTLVNKAILTAGNPEGDVLWGLDSTLLSRAVGSDVFEPYLSTAAPLTAESLALVPGGEVTPVNTSDVCLNIDIGWFAAQEMPPPGSFGDLAEPAYQDLLVVENPATSSPGLAFMLATVAEYGADGFAEYWAKLRTNGVLAVDSWDAAYFTEFTAGGGGGSRPIVVSYASSPPFGVVDGTATTASVESTCYRVVEFAGILRGSKHPAEARQLIDFMVSEAFQAELPDSNYVYPVRIGTPLPAAFAEFGKPATAPLMVAPGDIAANRETWIEQWTDAVVG